MEHAKSSLEIVEEWKKKCYDFCTQSDDELASTMMRLLEASAMILKGSDHSRIQRALTLLENERSFHLHSENTEEPSIRTMMFGVLQSIQGTLLKMISFEDSTPKEIQADGIPNSALQIVEQWKKKCYELFTQSDDALASTMTRLLEATAMILKGTDNYRVQQALPLLENERSFHLLSENNEEPSIRIMMFGVLQSIHGTLLDMTSSKVSKLSEEIQADEKPNSSPSLPTKPIEEPVDNSQLNPDNKQIPAQDLMAFNEEDIVEDDTEAAEMDEDGSKSLDGVSMVPNFTHPIPIEPKEELKDIKEEANMDDNKFPAKPKQEPVDTIQDLPDNIQMNDEMDPFMGEDNNEIISNRKEMNGTVESEIGGKDSSPISIEKEEVDEEEKTDESKNTRMKRKSSNNGVSESESAKKKCQEKAKGNSTELDCPKCEYRTRSVSSWMTHIRNSHSTSLEKAGLALLCECGNESRSEVHSRKCDIANFTVVHRDADVQTTPQCLLCEKHPKTMMGYMMHLKDYHKSTLKKNNIFLKCSCGFNVVYFPGSTNPSYKIHSSECDSRQFTVHKLDEK